MNKFFVFCFLLICSSLFSQEIVKGEEYQYARKIVDTMTSASMLGRGYVNDGDGIAANYIRNEFKKDGLKSFTDDYYQSLSFAVNTFPGKVKVSIDGKELVAGKDYLVSENSGSATGTYRLIPVAPDADSAIVISAKEKGIAAIVKSKKYPIKNDANAPIIYLEKTKLTQDVAESFEKYPAVVVLTSSMSAITTDSKISLEIENKFIKNHQTQNVIGYVSGSEHPDSFIVFTAHYDHLGQMGKDVYFPGANDNASGCAMLLNLAKYYSLPENRPKYSIAFIAFCGEEVGLLGSKYYVEHPLFPLSRIRFLLNMDIMGTGEEGITVVNGTIFKSEFDKLKEINTKNNFIKDVKIRGKAANSDHYPFSEKGIHACFIYTMGGIKAYHDIYDRGETLPLNEFEHLFKLITTFESELEHR